jgi:hypothetical protein
MEETRAVEFESPHLHQQGQGRSVTCVLAFFEAGHQGVVHAGVHSSLRVDGTAAFVDYDYLGWGWLSLASSRLSARSKVMTSVMIMLVSLRRSSLP